jgi:hypothetical protein
MTKLCCVTQVLKFDAWYQQTVNESQVEHYRVRHVNIYYYLEDDSIAVNEPQVENSGLPQGMHMSDFGCLATNMLLVILSFVS